MAKEWLEWLEIPQPASFPEQKKEYRYFLQTLPAMRRWLDVMSVAECFRCGYNYLSGELHSDYLRASDWIPTPEIQTVTFQEEIPPYSAPLCAHTT